MHTQFAPLEAVVQWQGCWHKIQATLACMLELNKLAVPAAGRGFVFCTNLERSPHGDADAVRPGVHGVNHAIHCLLYVGQMHTCWSPACCGCCCGLSLSAASRRITAPPTSAPWIKLKLLSPGTLTLPAIMQQRQQQSGHRGYWHIVLLLALRVHKEGRYDYKRCLDRQGGHVLPSSPYLLIERTSKQQSGSTSQQLLPLFSIKRL